MSSPPYRIFWFTMSACHVLPAVVMTATLIVFGFALFAGVSHYIPPVQLDTIWLEPDKFAASEIAAGRAKFTLKKSGKWRRLCAVEAKQVFIDKQGSVRFIGETHTVDTPKPNAERLKAKPRPDPDPVPKVLATSPGEWRLQLVNINGACWPWEHLWPIVPSIPVEATFTITAE